MGPHHLRQKFKRPPPLINNIHELLLRPNSPDNDLIFPTSQTLIRLVAELSERHSQRSPFLLAHIVVQLGLHRRWGDFKDFDVRASADELFAEAEREAIQCGFGGRVGGHVPGWDNSEVGAGASVHCQ